MAALIPGGALNSSEVISDAVAGGFLFYGLNTRDEIARDFGITFLLIFIYTKYFEYFWDHTNKMLFFADLPAPEH